MSAPSTRATSVARVLTVLGTIVLGAPGVARAEDACDTHFLAAQKAEKAGKLVQSLEAFSACSVPSCGENMSDVCNKRRMALAEKLPSVVVFATETSADASKPVANVTVTIDGEPIVTVGAAVPVDPGPHTFAFVAPDGRTKKVDYVVLEGKKSQEVSVSFASAEAPPAASTSAKVDAPHSGSSQRTYGLVLAGGGVVVAGLGGVLALVAKGKFNSSNQGNCDAATNLCNADGLSQRDSALKLGSAATVFAIVGGLAAAGGAVLWLTAPSSAEKSPSTGVTSIGVGPTGLVLGGRF